MSTNAVLTTARKAWQPPPRLLLSDWIERYVILPGGASALPGPMRLFPYQRAIADAMSDPEIERISLVKASRIGFTALIVAAIGSYIQNDPAQILIVLPTEGDCRDMCVSDLEPVFAATPVLRNALKVEAGEADRNTILSRRFPGGNLKIVPSRAPRSLRRHTSRLLFIDEADACEQTVEGDPIALAEMKTTTFPDRKIVIGSTPIYAETSNVLKSYAQSDQRIYEVPCPECGTFGEILWASIKWDENKPETAKYLCPSCGSFVDEKHKFSMVSAGRWRATRPEIVGHAGFKLNALVSLIANASWPQLAAQWIAAQGDVGALQVFVNTVLAEPWSDGGGIIDDASIASRAKDFSLDKIPDEIRLITCGIDVQDDRLEITICGWNSTGVIYVLDHEITWGSPHERTVWEALESLLASKWKHPFGGQIGVSAAVVDSGDGETTQKVYDFAFPRAGRNIMAGKGVAGTRPIIEASKGKVGKGGGRLWVLGVDGIKGALFDKLQRDQAIYFSNTLPLVFYEQLCAERKVRIGQLYLGLASGSDPSPAVDLPMSPIMAAGNGKRGELDSRRCHIQAPCDALRPDNRAAENVNYRRAVVAFPPAVENVWVVVRILDLDLSKAMLQLSLIKQMAGKQTGDDSTWGSACMVSATATNPSFNGIRKMVIAAEH